MSRRLLAASLVAASVATGACPNTADAQPRRRGSGGIVLKGVPASPGEATTTGSSSLLGLLGVDRAAQLLESAEPADCMRAYEQLGAIGTATAVERLVRALEPGTAARSPEERLVGARALAVHTRRPEVRRVLIQLMSGAGVGPPGGAATALEQLARETAAMALAASGEPDAIVALGSALRHEGTIAEAASRAVVAHPPVDLEGILRAPGTPTTTLVRTLAALDDQRGFHLLRSVVRRGTTEARAEAAVALTRLGDLETVALARFWRDRESAKELLVAAATILCMAGAPDAPGAVASLLDHPPTREAGVELALSAPSPELVEALERAIARSDDPRLLVALGRTRTARAIRQLTERLAVAPADAAAFALATAPADAAGRALEAALESPATRRLAVRAAATRFVTLGETVPGTASAARTLLESDDASDRAVAAWTLATLEPERASAFIASDDAVVVRAAARAGADRGAAAAADRFVDEGDPMTRAALAAAVADLDAANRVPTARLLSVLELGGADAPIVARALAARFDEEIAPHLRRLFAGGDPLARAHVALGLGAARRRAATGILEEAYRFETDPNVRWAIVVGLSRRPGNARSRPLSLAARLDPDPRVREAARIALRGRRLDDCPSGHAVLWTRLSEADGDATIRALAVGAPGGAAPPAVADPDGLLVVGGLAPGSVAVRLATPAGSEHGERGGDEAKEDDGRR